jgi:hypothetical protein
MPSPAAGGEILIVVSSRDYNFLFLEALHSWRELALLDLLIFSTKTFEAPRISAVVDRGGRTRETGRSHD